MLVCGDLHGQFYDLLTFLDLSGPLGSQNLLFLGDYVDRGKVLSLHSHSYSVQVTFLQKSCFT